MSSGETEAHVPGLLEAECLVRLGEFGSRLRAAIDAAEVADSVARRAGISSERQRELGNLTEWCRMIRMRVERLSQRIAEGAP